MKYLKTYKGNKKNKSLEDKISKMFLLNTYWAFTNDLQHSICKVISSDNKLNWIEFDIFLITKENKPYNKFLKLGFSYEDINLFLIDNDNGTIMFKEATEGDIEKFSISKETDKYNL